MDPATATAIVVNRLRPLLAGAREAARADPRALPQLARDLLIEILPYRHGFSDHALDALARDCAAAVAAAPAA